MNKLICKKRLLLSNYSRANHWYTIYVHQRKRSVCLLSRCQSVRVSWFYLWFLLQGLGLQGSLEIHDPNSNWLSWRPTHRAIHALGYVRPFWPHTGTNWSTQLHGKPAKATQSKGMVHTYFLRWKIHSRSLSHPNIQEMCRRTVPFNLTADGC